MNFKNWINKIFKNSDGILNKQFKNPKKLMMNLIIILLCGVLLILISDISSNMVGKKNADKKSSVEVTSNEVKQEPSSSYEDNIKKDIYNTLSEIEGVGKLSVMIYFEGGSQTVPAVNINDSDKRTEEKDNSGGTRVTVENNKNQNIVLVNEGGESKPFIVKQYNPSIGGVVIVAEGADNAVVRERLLIAAKTALNLSSSKVTIQPMKKSYEK